MTLGDAPDDPNAGSGETAMDMKKAVGYVDK